MQKGIWTTQRGRCRSNRPNQKLFLTLLIQIKIKHFWKRALFTETSDPRTLFLPELGPACNKSRLAIYKIFTDNILRSCRIYYYYSNSFRCFHSMWADLLFYVCCWSIIFINQSKLSFHFKRLKVFLYTFLLSFSKE